MAFEPVFEVTKLDSLKRLCSSQAVVEARLLPSSGSAIVRVLSIATDCTVSPSEVFAGEARYKGKVCFKVIFVDTEGNNHSMDYNADFTDKLNCEQIIAGIKPIVSCKVLDTDIVNVSEKEIKLACVVEVFLDAVISESVNVLVKGGENVYTHDDKMEFSKLVCENSETITFTDTLSDVKCNNILLSEPKVVIISATAGIDNVVVDGKIICDFTCESDDGMILSYQAVMSFLQEVSAPGALKENMCFAFASINSHKATMESDDKNNAIAISYDLMLSAKVFSVCECSPIVDAFSVTNELLQAGQSINLFKNKYCATISDRVDGSVTLDINMPIADNILAVTGSKINIANTVASEGRVTFEGVVSCSIIYYSAEVQSKNSVAVELPFSLNTNADVSDGDTVTAKGVVSRVNTKIRRGNEIDIKAEVEIEIMVSSFETKFVITELSLGEERALPTSAFQIHIARGGETLWDVSKSLGTTPEIVLLQNPTLTLPLSGGERVIAYRHLK